MGQPVPDGQDGASTPGGAREAQMEASLSTARPWRPDGAHGAHGALAAVAGPLSLLDKLNLLLGAAPSPSVAWTSQKGLSREAALRWLLAAVVTTTAAAQDAVAR